MIRAGEESLDRSVSLWYKTQHLAAFTGMPRVRAPRVLLGDGAWWGTAAPLLPERKASQLNAWRSMT